MSSDAKTAEAGKPEVPKLMRSFSKGYQKTKEALKKGFTTTPRGSRSLSGRLGSTEMPDLEPTAPPEAPQVPSKPVKEGIETGTTAATDVAVKATVKGSDDGVAPVEVKLEPVTSSKPPLAQPQEPVAPNTPTSAPPSAPAPAPPKVEGPLVQAPASAQPPASEDPKTEEATWTAEADVADKVQAAVEEVPAEKEEGPAKEEAALPGSEPPEVRVLVNGMETDAAKPEAEAEKPEPVILHAEPVRSCSGGKAKKAVFGLVALAAVTAVSLIVRGKIER